MKSSNKQQYEVFLVGKEVDLIVLSEDIINHTQWYSWFNDSDITSNMQQHYHPNSKADQLEYFNENLKNSHQNFQLGILHKGDNKLIGVISLNAIDHLNKKCKVAIIIGEKKYQSMNYFLESNRLIFDHAVNTLGIRRIEGGSLSKEVALLHERMLGFHSEGTKIQEVFKDGEYRDVYYFAKLFN
jgi:RimJ/RimL family protein N-acetyltransferase